MNLKKMLSAQKVLDDFIKKEKRLGEQDLFPNTVVALEVELCEMANESRWFKHWSKDREPRTKKKIECYTCNGTGDEHYEFIQEAAEGEGGHEYIQCEDCKGSGYSGYSNPQLEEYADSLHFFLSIAIQKGWEEALYLHEEALMDLEAAGFHGGLTGAFLEMMYLLNTMYIEIDSDDKKILGFTKQEFNFRSAWFLFIAIGTIGFGFTMEQIEDAYFTKNKINHQRQESGY